MGITILSLIRLLRNLIIREFDMGNIGLDTLNNKRHLRDLWFE